MPPEMDTTLEAVSKMLPDEDERKRLVVPMRDVSAAWRFMFEPLTSAAVVKAYVDAVLPAPTYALLAAYVDEEPAVTCVAPSGPEKRLEPPEKEPMSCGAVSLTALPP